MKPDFIKTRKTRKKGFNAKKHNRRTDEKNTIRSQRIHKDRNEKKWEDRFAKKTREYSVN